MFCVIAPEKDVTDAACFLQLWDIRKKAAIQTFQNTYQVLAVTFNDTSDQIISGGIDNDIKVWLFICLYLYLPFMYQKLIFLQILRLYKVGT